MDENVIMKITFKEFLVEDFANTEILSSLNDKELEQKYQELMNQDTKKGLEGPRKDLLLTLITNELSRRKYQKQKDQEASVEYGIK